MAKGFNKVILMGNLTRDPEVRNLPSGQSVASFSLAISRSWRGADGEQHDAVSYIDCVAWGKTGEIIAQYVQKGRPLLVSGRLEQRSWDDKESGQKRSRIEVIVEDFNFVGGGAGERSGAPAPGGSSSSSSSKKQDDVVEDIGDEPINLDDIPF
ncbi:MAG TPA: single-stranded DNA-binding protein [Candidatus Pristimantibacillus sp.]|nr:single-stranded DNA-binding protein [Candidatus Pristimantibacillus sp.]